jgi:hypothetical protein
MHRKRTVGTSDSFDKIDSSSCRGGDPASFASFHQIHQIQPIHPADLPRMTRDGGGGRPPRSRVLASTRSMNKHSVLVLLLVLGLAAPGVAGSIGSIGGFFGKKSKPNPKERVPELIAAIKTDGDENKRAAAAEELRQYDPAQNPEIVPVLIDVLINDKKPSVRAEAASTLGKMRPVSQSAGLALEQALAKDASMRVRLQARTSLLQYHWAGYRSVKKDEPLVGTKEPPLADPPEKTKPRLASDPVEKGRPRVLIRKASQPRIAPQPQAEPTVKEAPTAPVPPPPPLIRTIPGAKPLPPGPVEPPSNDGDGPEITP